MLLQKHIQKYAIKFQIPFAFFNSTRQAIWMGRQDVWYGSFSSTLEKYKDKVVINNKLLRNSA